MRAASTLLLLALTGAAEVAAASRPAEEAVRRIDAVIADRQGQPITNLPASDLELTVDGVPRPILAAEHRTVPRFVDAPALPIVTDLDETAAARERGTRVFAFYLDELEVSTGVAAARAREVVGDFIDQKVHQRDLTLVMRSGDARRAGRFSRDRGLARGTLAAFAGRRGRVTGTGDALQELALRLRTLRPDRGVLVIVSEALDGDLELVARAAADAHLTVYVFDPSERTRTATRPARPDAAAQLAAETGGLAFDAPGAIAGFARIAHDTEAFWSLTFEAGPRDDARHTVDLRLRRGDARVRAPAAYWATPETRWVDVAVAPAPLPGRLLRRSATMDTWYGLARDAAGGSRMTVTWEPARALPPSARVTITARAPSGAVIFAGRVAAVGRAGPGLDDSARFAAPAGTIEIDLVALDEAGGVLDTEARDVDVPEPGAPPPGGLLPIGLVRARTEPDLARAIRDPDTPSAATRTFRRSDRLLVRVPTVADSVRVAARLLDRTGQPLRTLEALDALDAPGTGSRFALPLSSLAPGRYQVEIAGTLDGETLTERIPFTVEG